MSNLFKQAAAYRKKHPSVSQAQAVKICAKKNKVGKKVGKVRKKRAAPKKAAPRKTRTKTKTKTKTVVIGKARKKKSPLAKMFSLSGVSMSKIAQEHSHQRALESAIKKHRAMLKTKGMPAMEKNRIRREIDHYKDQISASKKHVTVLKRSI
jgi:hypothetical protein